MFKMGLHDPFGHLTHKLWPKERPRVKLAIWLPTIKSRQSTWFPCFQVVCNIPLVRSWRGLKLCFKLHLNPRFAHKVMGPQSWDGSPNFGNFGTPTWESQDKMPFGCGSRGEAQNILYIKENMVSICLSVCFQLQTGQGRGRARQARVNTRPLFSVTDKARQR